MILESARASGAQLRALAKLPNSFYFLFREAQKSAHEGACASQL